MKTQVKSYQEIIAAKKSFLQGALPHGGGRPRERRERDAGSRAAGGAFGPLCTFQSLVAVPVLVATDPGLEEDGVLLTRWQLMSNLSPHSRTQSDLPKPRREKP